ncbi:hypothetical protein AWJ20_2418 [Sugiyamaella lignohabitans]|uniref:PROP1-like PPR domain-containing protein n=1 Tax=Sugiyamaella lignohabitans TaxID=796027 RepID=A0A161HMC1_9ASCO|nr:uncharacterized protein AWJ20_2418 [Sugiyamaella lignohabitans]ANB14807.1 hypothetical protein AWJ20_2418 [Sugiyamaella lignohabitans]
MIFKPLSNLSRHAALAKHLWVQTGGHNQSSQPSAFFLTTNQLARQQSQLAVRHGNGFGSSGGSSGEDSTTTASYATIGSSSTFQTITPLSSLDDEKHREILEAAGGVHEPANSSASGGYMMYNHQRTLVKPKPVTEFHRRYSIDARSEAAETRDQKVDATEPKNASVNSQSEVAVEQAGLNPEIESQPQHQQQSDELLVQQVELTQNEETEVSSSLLESESQVHSQTLSDVQSQPQTRSVSQSSAPSSIASLEQLTVSKTSAAIPNLGTVSVSRNSTSFDDQISIAFSSSDYERVIELYRTLFPSKPLSIHAFNKVLISIANVCTENTNNPDLGPLLDAYTSLLSTKALVPNVHTYSILITTLLESADKLGETPNLINLRNVESRHANLLPSVASELAKALEVASMYSDLVFQLFEASNSVKVRNYPSSIYVQLLDAAIKFNKLDQLPKIIQHIQSSSSDSSLDVDLLLIKSYGLTKDVKSATEVFNKYQKGSKSQFSPELVSAMVSTYFHCDDAASAAQLVETIINDRSKDLFVQSPEFEQILVQVFTGFARLGQYSDTWAWLQQAESDSSICPISLDTLVKTFSSVCNARADSVNVESDGAVVHQMFDFVAAIKASSNSDLFNDARCDYINYCISTNNLERLYKAISETQYRGGIWDETTLFRVVQFLSQQGQLDLALNVFQMQSFRLKKYLAENDASDQYSAFGEEVLSLIVAGMKSQNQLTMDNALAVAKSGFMTPRVFANTNGGGIDVMQAIWAARSNGVEIYSSARSLALDIVDLHCTWIQSCTQGSLGNLSIPTEIAQELTKNFKIFIQDIISQKLPISNVLHENVESSLQLLNDYASIELWNDYFHKSQKPESPPFVEEARSEPFTIVNLDASAEIIGYARTEHGVMQALNTLRDTFIRKELVTPDAILYLVEAAATGKLKGANEIIREVYSLSLQYLPPHTMAPQAWDAWCAIHRSIVTHSAETDYALAEQAYVSLLNMGSCPDATSYGQLMAHAPTNGNRDEAVDAMRMFNEARASGIPLNTFIYNVLLSKLSKARKLKEAVAVFDEMDRLNIKKSNVTYGTMISACCRAGDGDFAMKLFNEMERSPLYIPKVAPFNIMLQYFVHAKQDRQSALKVYNQLRALGLKPSPHTYKLLIDMYSTIEPIDIASADKVLLTIKEDGSEVTSQHFAALLFTRGVVKNDLAAAQEFYDVLVHERKIRPDKVIFQALLESYVVNNKVRDTTKVLQEMIAYGVDLNAYMANILIRGWASISLDKSVGLFDYILQGNIAEPSSYESIIRAFIFHGDFTSANNVLNLMRTNRYPEAVVQKVDTLIKQSATTTPSGDRILLDSIFRHDAHRLHAVNAA